MLEAQISSPSERRPPFIDHEVSVGEFALMGAVAGLDIGIKKAATISRRVNRDICDALCIASGVGISLVDAVTQNPSDDLMDYSRGNVYDFSNPEERCKAITYDAAVKTNQVLEAGLEVMDVAYTCAEVAGNFIKMRAEKAACFMRKQITDLDSQYFIVK